MVHALKLIHIPLGDEHPYEQKATERFPRFPMAGEAVTLGAATAPVGRADTVAATWKIKGSGATGRAEGVRRSNDDKQDYWQLQLPAFAAGDEVSYQVFSSSGKHHVTTEEFSFEVLDWIEIGRLLAYRRLPSAIELTCATDLPGISARLQVVCKDNRNLRLRLELGRINERGPTGLSFPKTDEKSQLGVQITEENDERIVLSTSEVQLVVNRHPCLLGFYRKDGSPLLVEKESTKWLVGGEGQAREVQQVFECPSDEAFYGFGERFNALNQRGNVLDIRVYEQYKEQGRRTYMPVPFFISNRGYGAYWDTSRYISYDLGVAIAQGWSFRGEVDDAGGLDYELILDDDPKAVLKTFADLSGHPVLPPAWVFGPWMSSNEWNSQAAVFEQVRKSVELEIPATVVVIEAWSDEATFYIWNDAQYTPKTSDEPFVYSDFTFPPHGKWPDPKKMVKELHDEGMRVLLWQVPVLKKMEHAHRQNHLDETTMIEKGYCVHDGHGEPYQVKPPWFAGGLVLDFTSAEAAEWWLNKRAYLLDELGVDGFKTDGGEHLWGHDLVFADGRRGAEIWNLYPNLYVKAYHQLLKTKDGGEAITFSRSGFTGAQQFPCHWAGDENSTWEALRASILAGLNAGLSGIPFWGWDIAGFSGEIPSAELYLRATEMAAFCPIMQYHSEFNDHRVPSIDRTPWNIQERTGDQDVVPIYRKFANLRMNLLPYIYSQAKTTSETGIPLMRALPLEFGEDEDCEKHAYQYLFGESLLVAPVVRENTMSQTVYLPPGGWYDFWTDKRFDGPLLVDYPSPKDILPVFAKAGTMLPLNLNDTYELGGAVGNRTDGYKNLALKIYPQDGGEFAMDWFDLVSGKYYKFRWKRGSKGGNQLDVPSIPYDLALIIGLDKFSPVMLGGEPILLSSNLEELNESGKARWHADSERGLTYVKLTRTDLPCKIRFEATDQG